MCAFSHWIRCCLFVFIEAMVVSKTLSSSRSFESRCIPPRTVCVRVCAPIGLRALLLVCVCPHSCV